MSSITCSQCKPRVFYQKDPGREYEKVLSDSQVWLQRWIQESKAVIITGPVYCNRDNPSESEFFLFLL
jgi:hypothetical protein